MTLLVIPFVDGCDSTARLLALPQKDTYAAKKLEYALDFPVKYEEFLRSFLLAMLYPYLERAG